MSTEATIGIVAAAVSIAVQLGTIIATIVWAIGRIREQTSVLDTAIQNLTSSIKTLSRNYDQLDDKVDVHNDRLARIETKIEKIVQ